MTWFWWVFSCFLSKQEPRDLLLARNKVCLLVRVFKLWESWSIVFVYQDFGSGRGYRNGCKCLALERRVDWTNPFRLYKKAFFRNRVFRGQWPHSHFGLGSAESILSTLSFASLEWRSQSPLWSSWYSWAGWEEKLPQNLHFQPRKKKEGGWICNTFVWWQVLISLVVRQVPVD